jgi:hypothetical protein
MWVSIHNITNREQQQNEGLSIFKEKTSISTIDFLSIINDVCFTNSFMFLLGQKCVFHSLSHTI